MSTGKLHESVIETRGLYGAKAAVDTAERGHREKVPSYTRRFVQSQRNRLLAASSPEVSFFT